MKNLLEIVLKELSGQDWEVEAKQDKWDLYFICKLGEFRRQTQDLDIGEVELIEEVKRQAEYIYYVYESWKRRSS